MDDALNRGHVDVPRLRQILAVLPQPAAAGRRLILTMDVTHWLRPDAPTSADRLFCHGYGRGGRSSDQFVPGWPYSRRAGVGPDLVAPDPRRAAPGAGRRRRRGHRGPDPPRGREPHRMGRWQAGDREILIVLDAGYDAPRLAYLLEGLPVEILGGMRTGRVARRPGSRCRGSHRHRGTPAQAR
ncbi:transposase [Streptomyces olivaceoviridis]